MCYGYYLAYDDGNMILKIQPSSLVQRYDEKSGQWISDVELSQVFFGGIPVKGLTAEEVKERIGDHL